VKKFRAGKYREEGGRKGRSLDEEKIRREKGRKKTKRRSEEKNKEGKKLRKGIGEGGGRGREERREEMQERGRNGRNVICKKKSYL
jgi:hypothetical protein